MAARVLAAGSNSHHQLSTSNDDVRSFQALSEPSLESINTDILYASWSTTTIHSLSELINVGYRPWTTPHPPVEDLHCPFGDHNGLIGCLDIVDRVWLLHLPDPANASRRQPPLSLLNDDPDAPKIGLFALANNGRVALSFQQAPNGRLAHIVEFVTLEGFKEWYLDPSDPGKAPAAHHMLPGRPGQLLANAATFLLSMEEGELYSWGDPRYRTLGRSIIGENAVPANEPGLINALGGMKVTNIACGGWLSAALCDEALYIWGSTLPGKEGEIKALTNLAVDEVHLVDLPGADESAEVLNISVGDNHIACVCSDGRLFVIGDNTYGQLGLGEQLFFDDWVEVPSIKAHRVKCGPQSTFVRLKQDMAPS